MDIIDNASELEELHRNAALSRPRMQINSASTTHCRECEEALPETRRIAIPGCQLCTSCKGVEEFIAKQRAQRAAAV